MEEQVFPASALRDAGPWEPVFAALCLSHPPRRDPSSELPHVPLFGLPGV